MVNITLKLIVRNLWNHKVHAGINILGLSIGLATCLLMLLYVQHELSYDRFNVLADRIVRITFRGTVQGQKMNESSVMPPVAATLEADYPEVEAATRLRQAGTPMLVYQGNEFRDAAAAYIDPDFFQVFTLPLLQGDAKTALADPNALVLTQTMAQRLFGMDDPLGKIVRVDDWNKSYTVTGVLAPIPENAHFHFDVFLSTTGLPEAQSDSWMTSNFFTYLVLDKHASFEAFEAKLPQTVAQYIGPQMQVAMGMSLSDFRKQGNDLSFHVQPLTDIHMDHGFANDLSPSGNIQYVYGCFAIAILVLLIACINFMNLSTAVAGKRAPSVGIHKLMGSSKGHLIRSFLLESMLLTSIALGLALGMVAMILPAFNDFFGVLLSINPVSQPWMLPGLCAVGIITSLLAGAYPAYFLSNFKPVAVLKGHIDQSARAPRLRNGLVVFQFFVSIMLIISTLVVYSQLHYIRSKQLGYKKEQVLILPDVDALAGKWKVFEQTLTSDPNILQISTSGFLPAGASNGNNYFISAETKAADMIKAIRYEVDAQYIPTLGMEVLHGRKFSAAPLEDSTTAIINETAALALGMEGERAIGQTILHADKNGNKERFEIIGVVRDFHFKSLHEPISPLVMLKKPDMGNIILKVRSEAVPGLIATLRSNWMMLNSKAPFTYSFLEDRFEETYRAEQKTGILLGIFAGLTILVACLGLLGLAIFTTNQRRKEIGIRKVLGASVLSIVGTLSTPVLKWIFWAMLIACPTAYYIMQAWLSDFAYRIEIQGWIFFLAGCLTVFIAFLTVAGQAARAARQDPMKSLRNT